MKNNDNWNYKTSSPLPVDRVTGEWIAFGTPVVRYNDDSITKAENAGTPTWAWTQTKPYELTAKMWSDDVAYERECFAEAEAMEAWMHTEDARFYAGVDPVFGDVQIADMS